MKIKAVSAANFQSYPNLTLDFSRLGLTGVFGTTGAGKSTLLDVVPYALWGITGKGAAVDDVRPWGCDAPTVTLVRVGTPTGEIAVCRVRALGKNDLHWAEVKDNVVGPPNRGKDLKDTQRLLNERLGISAELFLLSGYMTQFSDADAFFISSAKERRAVLEKIADQEFAIKLGERTADARKAAKKQQEQHELERAKATGEVETLKRVLAKITEDARSWEANRAKNVAELEKKCFSYAEDVAKAAAKWDQESLEKLNRLHATIESLPEPKPAKYFDEQIARLKAEARCPTCNALSDKHSEHIARLREEKSENQRIEEKLNRLTVEYTAEVERVNPHQITENIFEARLRDLKAAPNPFSPNLDVYADQMQDADARRLAADTGATQAAIRMASLTWLYDKSFEIRGLMMERVVAQIQEKTNYYLEKYFDGALRVQFSCAGSDKIEVTLLNDGHECPFTALSGGERCMLKLAFSLSVMRAAQNKAGVSINCVMLDEPLNGLPDELKIKAFGLFDELTNDYSSVLVIDHSDAFKALFHKQYTIDKINGKSILVE